MKVTRFGFWAYDPENYGEDKYYSFLSREEAVKAQQELGDGTPIEEYWQNA
jgi:hypothetical protein